ncbi:MAG TPA: DUF4112 domain-containing protein [Acidobacteriota bacterium]|jgi:hypothetical protein
MGDEIREGRVTRLDDRQRARFEQLQHWSFLLDKAFRVPGTRFRFGWDAIIGLFPGFGDLITTILSTCILVNAFQMRIPRVIQAKMVLNVLIDLFVGVVPFVGDAIDFVWKSNTKNMRLLEKHAFEAAEPTLWDWIFVVSILGALALALLLPIMFIVWLSREIGATL